MALVPVGATTAGADSGSGTGPRADTATAVGAATDPLPRSAAEMLRPIAPPRPAHRQPTLVRRARIRRGVHRRRRRSGDRSLQPPSRPASSWSRTTGWNPTGGCE
ncbi:hypothetical protein NKH77_22690 [Streptomyces sp. M19]